MATKKVVTSKLGMLKSEQKKGYSAAKQDNKAKLKSGAMDHKTYKTAMQNVKASQKKDREDLVKTQPDARKKTVQYMDAPDKKPGSSKGPKKPGKGDMMSKPVKQPVVKKPVKGGPKEQGTGKVFKTPEKAQEDKKQAAPVQTLKKGGMACKKYARGGGIEVRGKTKGKFI